MIDCILSCERREFCVRVQEETKDYPGGRGTCLQYEVLVLLVTELYVASKYSIKNGEDNVSVSSFDVLRPIERIFDSVFRHVIIVCAPTILSIATLRAVQTKFEQ